MKSAQCGISEWLLNIGFWLASTFGLNSTMIEPTDSALSDFIHGRVDPAIAESPYLSSIVQDTDNIRLKRVGKAFIYFRGTQKARKLKMIDSDCMLYDELDELSEGTVARGNKRLGHSNLRWVRAVSTPTYPDDGVDKEYGESNKMRWFIKCDRCNEWQTLNFFDNVDVKTCTTICCGCKKPIDRLKEGEWVAERPRFTSLHGYHINKLFCERTVIKDLVEHSRKTNQFEIQEFYNSDLGLPYAPKGNRIIKSELRACRSGSYSMPCQAEHTTMGVDVGIVLNVKIVVQERGHRKVVYIGVVDQFEDLDHLMLSYDVDVCVVDANPETRKAKEFQARFEGRVYLAYYWPSDDKRTELFMIKEDEPDEPLVVLINRTQAGDNVVSDIQKRVMMLPANFEQVEDYLNQMVAPLRIIKEDGRGNEVAVYEEFGKPDHFFHATIYSYIAERIRDDEEVVFSGSGVQGSERVATSEVYAQGGRDSAASNMDW